MLLSLWTRTRIWVKCDLKMAQVIEKRKERKKTKLSRFLLFSIRSTLPFSCRPSFYYTITQLPCLTVFIPWHLFSNDSSVTRACLILSTSRLTLLFCLVLFTRSRLRFIPALPNEFFSLFPLTVDDKRPKSFHLCFCFYARVQPLWYLCLLAVAPTTDCLPACLPVKHKIHIYTHGYCNNFCFFVYFFCSIVFA